MEATEKSSALSSCIVQVRSWTQPRFPFLESWPNWSLQRTPQKGVAPLNAGLAGTFIMYPAVVVRVPKPDILRGVFFREDHVPSETGTGPPHHDVEFINGHVTHSVRPFVGIVNLSQIWLIERVERTA